MDVIAYGENEITWIYEDVKSKLYFIVGDRKEEVYIAINEIFDNIYLFAKNIERDKFKITLMRIH